MTRAPALLALLAAVACDGSSASRDAAERFVARYYDPGRVAEALPLATGAAKERVAAELEFMRGVPAPAAAAPALRLRRQAPTRTRAVYGYDVRVNGRDARTLLVRVVVVEDGGEWRVAALDEKDPRKRKRAPEP